MKIAAFNARQLGKKKLLDPDVSHYLVKIVSRYDIIVILGLADKDKKYITKFMEELNRVDGNQYESHHLEKTSSKEQFLFIYRIDVVELSDTYQYEDEMVDANDDDTGVFERKPYILRFKLRGTVLEDIVLIPVRIKQTKAEDAAKELDELHKVILDVKQKWNAENIMILGNFKADTEYIKEEILEKICLRTDEHFHWLIGDEVNTTASTLRKRTYDRIVVYGQHMVNAVIPHSAKPFKFQEKFELPREMALKVSDHCPVEVELRSAPPQTDRECRGLFDMKKVLDDLKKVEIQVTLEKQ